MFLVLVCLLSVGVLRADPNDVTIEFIDDPNWMELEIGWTTAMTICPESGDCIEIDYGGDEVKVTGATEEGAVMFFEHLLKPYIDEYIESKRQEILEENCFHWIEEKANKKTIEYITAEYTGTKEGT